MNININTEKDCREGGGVCKRRTEYYQDYFFQNKKINKNKIIIMKRGYQRECHLSTQETGYIM